MEYTNEHIKIKLKIIPVEYGEDCRPLDPMIYQKLDQKHKGRKVFDIWERMEHKTESWFAVIDDDGEVTVEGDFKTYLHTGSYQDLMKIGMQIGGEHKNLKDFYFVYLNSPEEVEEKDLKTKIVFRE